LPDGNPLLEVYIRRILAGQRRHLRTSAAIPKIEQNKHALSVFDARALEFRNLAFAGPIAPGFSPTCSLFSGEIGAPEKLF